MSGFVPSAYQQAILAEVRTGRGDIVVSSVAGSGKSTTLREICKEIRSRNAILFSFNVHIKDHMAAVLKELGLGVEALTIHGYGYRALRRRYPHLGRPDEQKYRTIAEGVVLATAEADLLRQLHVPRLALEAQKVVKGRVQYLTNLARMARVTLADETIVEDLAELADKYDLGALDSPRAEGALWRALPNVLAEGAAQVERGAIDFTDMIWAPLRLGARPWPWEWALVDEAQDLSRCQYALVEYGRGKGARGVWVGDPFQAIMGFAGANARSYSEIKERTQAVELPLSICYRCPTGHIDLAKRIVPHLEAREGAPVGEIELASEDAYLAAAAEGDLILCRLTAPLIAMCLKLIRRKLPARVRGRDIARALAELIKTVERIEPDYRKFPAALDRYVEDQVRALVQREGTEEKVQRLRDMAEAVDVCYQGFDRATDALELCREIEGLFTDERASIWLSTIHRAKGLEAERVCIMRPALLPFDHPRMTPEQRAQEWNLFYVALTRAKRALWFLYEREAEIPDEPEVAWIADNEEVYEHGTAAV